MGSEARNIQWCDQPEVQQASEFACAEWARCRPWIEAALEFCYGTHRIEDVEAAIATGNMQFWPGERCAVVTEIAVYPQMRALNFFLVGGDLTELLEKMEPVIANWAKTEWGCSRVLLNIGRKGWAKVLQPLGYDTGNPVMHREI